VIISLPTHLHAQCTKQSAEAEKHIFLEKPIATNVKEAKEIVLASRRNSVKLMIGYPYRFEKEFKDLNVQLKSGVLGDVEIARATYISSGPFFHRTQDYSPAPVPQWWFNKELTGGGVLIDLGSHMINLLRWYFGEITDIRSLLGYRFNLDLEDSAICLAKFDSGTTAVITVGWFSQENKLNVEFLGSVKHATGQKPLQNPILTAVQLLTTKTTKFFHAHRAGLQYFVTCVADDLPPSPSGDDGIRDLEAISAAYNNQIHVN
jgi:predicted dehydrogenase